MLSRGFIENTHKPKLQLKRHILIIPLIDNAFRALLHLPVTLSLIHNFTGVPEKCFNALKHDHLSKVEEMQTGHPWVFPIICVCHINSRKVGERLISLGNCFHLFLRPQSHPGGQFTSQQKI